MAGIKAAAMGGSARRSPVTQRSRRLKGRSRRRKGLPANSFAISVMLLVQSGLGMGVNLYARVPAADQGAGIIAALGRALTSQPVVLAVHALLGLLMLVAGISVLVRAIVARHRLAIVSSAAGLAAHRSHPVATHSTVLWHLDALMATVAGVESRELREVWFRRALDRAGIERRSWHPGRGVEENRRTIEAVYGYYGRLFTEHPFLQWAGLAAMIGPAFYAGFRDVGVLPDAVRGAVIAALGRASRRLAGRAAGDLGFYETTFLIMQKKIFEDQAAMHEAYLAGGVAQIEEFYRARIIDAATLEAWRQIDAGRREAAADIVADGNRTLLFREQHDIIDRHYARMFAYRWPLGRTFTYLLTLAGAPSVPRARSFPQRYPLRVDVWLPPIAISARTPLADGNIALFADRWKLIDADTLPTYQAFIRDHPDQARALVAIPLSQRVTGYRLLARAGQLAAGALVRWDVDLRAAPAGPRTPGARAARRPLRAAATVIDLASAPTRQSAGFAAGAGSRVWVNPGRAPFDVTVALPGGRAYRAQAEMAVMLGSTPAGDPDRLTVQLPSASLDATSRLIGDYSAQWGFPADALTDWRTSAAQRASGDGYYRTRVFTPPEIGPVHLEFQVSHHVPEGDFVVAALFSWPAHAA